VIARIWSGIVAADRLADYVAYVDATGVGAYRETEGNRAAHILTRLLDDGTAEIMAFSLWDDEEAIRRFAGDDISAMVLYPEDREYLLRTPTLRHYSVVKPG
jgi:heme-degrading monooxygenase HmoA